MIGRGEWKQFFSNGSVNDPVPLPCRSRAAPVDDPVDDPVVFSRSPYKASILRTWLG